MEKVQIRLNLAVSLYFAQVAFMTGINAMRYQVKYITRNTVIAVEAKRG